MSGKSQFNITRYLARFLCSFILLIRTHTHTQTVRVVHARCHRVLCACFLFRHTFSSPLRCSRHFFVVALNHHTTFHCTTPHCLFFLPISLKLKLLFDTCTIAATHTKCIVFKLFHGYSLATTKHTHKDISWALSSRMIRSTFCRWYCMSLPVHMILQALVVVTSHEVSGSSRSENEFSIACRPSVPSLTFSARNSKCNAKPRKKTPSSYITSKTVP